MNAIVYEDKCELAEQYKHTLKVNNQQHTVEQSHSSFHYSDIFLLESKFAVSKML